MIYIQCESFDSISVEACSLLESIRYNNWFYYKDVEYKLVSYDNLNSITFSECDIPLGSVEFVNKFCSLINREYKPLYIKDIFNDRFTNLLKKDDILKLFETKTSLFIKEFDVFKSNFSDRYGYIFTKNDSDILLENNKYYFVSDIIEDIQSEYRIFIHNKEIVGIKNYSGDIFTFPDKNRLLELIDNISNINFKTNSLTIDISISGNGFISILEWHPFISVGLYGFDDPKLLLDMYIDGFSLYTKKETN